MEVILAENISEITLSQYQQYEKLVEDYDDENEFKNSKISIFTKIPKEQIGSVISKDYDQILLQIDKALTTEYKFEKFFTIDNIEFGFHPNLDEMSQAEYIDSTTYGVDVETLHKLMAVLFRPIINKDKFGNYQIESYEGTDKYSELMKRAPLNIVKGAIDFFYLLSKELQSHIQKYTANLQQQQMEQQSTLVKNGVGMTQ